MVQNHCGNKFSINSYNNPHAPLAIYYELNKACFRHLAIQLFYAIALKNCQMNIIRKHFRYGIGIDTTKR